MTEVFAYLRVSGKSQVRGDGFRRQFIAIRKYCEANGLRIVRIFKERGISGTKELEDRPALSKLFNALEENGIKTVVIERLDRLARDLMVSEAIIKDFRSNSYNLLSTCEPDLCSNDPSRKFIRVIFGALAELEKDLLVLKLRGARQRKKVQDGIARGYKGDDALKYGKAEGRKAYGEKPGEEETLQHLHRLRQQGLKMREIADRLNSEGRFSRYGRPWVPGSLSRILKRSGKKSAPTLRCTTGKNVVQPSAL